MQTNIYLKKEKQIQKEIQNRLSSQGYKYNIIDEENTDLKLNEEHKFLLLNPYSENGNIIFKGLKYYLEKHNKGLIEDFSDNYSKDQIIELITNDFISRWDKAKSNSEYYDLIFNSGFLKIELKNKNNTKVIKSYNVISFNKPADNEYTIIKEKRLEGKNGVERPDFAMYINGIPLIVWEVKTKQTTINSAFEEYTKKDTYKKFILCLGTDGEDIFLTGSKKMYFEWKKYGKHIASNYVFDIENFLFQKEHTVNEIIDIQNLLNNNIPLQRQNDFINIIKKYDDSVKFNDISNKLVNIVTKNPLQKNILINEIKQFLINQTSGLEDIISELFDSPSNLMFYFKYGVMIDKVDLNNKEDSEVFIINHRVQQYYTVKALNRKLNYLIQQNKKEALISELVKHVQRSGKSITIRSCVNLIEDKFQELFKKVYVCVPDLTILDVMRKTFANNKIKVKRITKREDFIKSIGEKNTVFTVYLYNIQKTKDPDSAELSGDDFDNIQKQYKDNDVLFIIDEVHYSQSKTQADIRNYCFPNASFLTFTATPKMKDKNDSIVNETAIRYGEANSKGQINYLDELNATDAIKMKIILPVAYEKINFSQKTNLEDAKEFDVKTKELLKQYLNKGEMLIKKQAEKDEEEEAIRSKLEPYLKNNDIEDSVIEEQIRKNNELIDKKYIERGLREIEKVQNTSALNKLRKEKIDFVVEDMNKKRKDFYSDKNNKPFFITKAFFVVKDQKEAQRYINVIKSLSKNNDNTYQNYRFGVDFSETQQSVSEISLLPELNGFSDDIKIIKKFEEQNINKDPVDILFIVDKYLMGYDNKELVSVYCDKTINEPSKLYQLITRSATTREGKPQGFFVDLTFGSDNYTTYTEKCLRYYNNNSETNIFTLNQEEIIIQKERLQNKLNDIKELLGYDKNDLLLDELDIYNKLLSLGENKTEAEIIVRKNKYFDYFKEINEIMKTLIKPQYYMENFEEILVLLKVNKNYYDQDCPKPEEMIIFDKNEIKNIIVQSLKFFNFNDLEDINSFQINNSKIKDTKLSARVDFNNVVTQFKQRVLVARENKPKGFTEAIKKWTEQIMSDEDAKLVINDFKKEFEEPFKKAQREKQEIIKNNYNNSLSWFIANRAMKKGYSLIEEFDSSNSYSKENIKGDSLYNEDYSNIFEDLLKEYSQLISSTINNILSNEKSNIENIEFYIDKILKNYSIDTGSLKDFKCLENLEESEFKKIRKIFWNDSKKIKNIMEQGRGISEITQSEISDNNFDTRSVWILFMLEDYYAELKNQTLSEKELDN